MPSNHKRNSRGKSSYIQLRRMLFERLEDRRLLTANWKNPIESLDVSNDQQVSPLDALIVINELNRNRSHALIEAKPAGWSFIDTNGDEYLTPLDALLVINALNQGYVSPSTGFVLQERNSASSQRSIEIEVGQVSGSRTYSFEIDTRFESIDTTSIIEDTFAVYLTNPVDAFESYLTGNWDVATPIFSISGQQTEYIPGFVKFDGRRVDIDLTAIESVGSGQLKFQLLNTDSDFGSFTAIRPITNKVEPNGTLQSPFFRQSESITTPAAALEIATMARTADVEVKAQHIKYDSESGTFRATLQVTNMGEPIGRDLAVAFPNLPEGVSLRNLSGMDSFGVPYVNLRNAIAAGGLGKNSRSGFIEVIVDTPQQTRFSLQADVFVGSANRPPSFYPIQPITLTPGEVVEVRLEAVDPDQDRVRYSLIPNSLMPATTLLGDGTLIIAPAPNQLGDYQFAVVASDGVLKATQTVTVTVVADSVTSTRVRGQVLEVDGTALSAMQVEIGGVSHFTDAQGFFTLDLGSGPIVSETLRIRGDLYASDFVYPFIAEKLPLLLEHGLYVRQNNHIVRPIYLPRLDVDGGTVISATQDTMVIQEIAPGEAASVNVKAGSLRTQLGTAFDGTLSITEVPIERTPAALPVGLYPDLVVTIQPGEMVFTQPAPLTTPNRAGLAPGTQMDLWSINPTSGEFEIVGAGRVSADGTAIETVSGGIRNSSWHFFAGSISNVGDSDRNEDNDCEECKHGLNFNSQVQSHSGVLMETHDTPTYRSLGTNRGISLVYDSMRADPRPIVHFEVEDAIPVRSNMVLRANVTVSDRLTSGIGGNGSIDLAWRMQLPGVQTTNRRNNGDNYWAIPARNSSEPFDVVAALQADLRDIPSGQYFFNVSGGLGILQNETFIGSTDGGLYSFTHVNAVGSPIGSGWGIAGVQELVLANLSAILIDGDGSEMVFDIIQSGNEQGRRFEFDSPPGDFSTLVQTETGFRRTTTDGTVYEFPGDTSRLALNTSFPLTSVTDRNGNRTEYQYNQEGNLVAIIDPVGLKTSLAFTNGKLSEISDPAQRVTTFVHDAEGNLERIIEPDGTFRTFLYDSNHHMTGEVDKRGFDENIDYNFAGRVIRGVRNDGTIMEFSPIQTQVLYSPEATAKFENLPLAVVNSEAKFVYRDANGNAVTAILDQQGQEIVVRDSIGAYGVFERNEENQITAITDARGNVTEFSYDSRGNLVQIADEVSGGGLADAVRWVGASGDWNDANHWSTGFVPGPQDDVLIDVANTDLTITHSVGVSIVKRIISTENIVIAGGTLSTTGSSSFRAGLTVSPGATLLAETAIVSVSGAININGANIESRRGGVFNFPSLTEFTNGVLRIDGPGSMVADNLTNFDNSRFLMSGGAVFRSVATAYSSTSFLGANTVLFSATGQGTKLNLSSLSSLNTRFNDNSQFAVSVYSILAKSGGTIDLSGVGSLTAPLRVEDRTDFIIDSGSNIDLRNLTTAISNSGIIRFEVSAPFYELPSLTISDGVVLDLGAGTTFSLPEVTQQTRGAISSPAQGVLNAPKLASVDSISISIGDGGMLNAPMLTSFTNSTLMLGSNQTLNAPPFTSIDNSSFRLSGGATLALGATSYKTTTRIGITTLFSATGEGTVLDLSSLETIDDRFDDRSSSHPHYIDADDGGVIDLSGLTLLRSPSSEDYVSIRATRSGEVILSRLQQTTGKTFVEFSVPSYSLPALTHASGMTFKLPVGGQLELPELVEQTRGGLGEAQINSGRFEVSANGVINAPELITLEGTTIAIGAGGTLNAPKLTTFTDGLLTLGAGQTLIAPGITNLDNSSIHIGGGIRYSVAAISYRTTSRTPNRKIFWATGAETVLDLSSIVEIDDRFDAASSSQHHYILAEQDAVIRLPNAISLKGPSAEDVLYIQSRTGGSVELPSSPTITGNVVIDAGDGEGEINSRIATVVSPQSDVAVGSIAGATSRIQSNRTAAVPLTQRNVASAEGENTNRKSPKLFEYDAKFSQLTRMTDELGRIVLFEVDPTNGNRLSMTQVIGLLDTASAETDDLVTTYSYTTYGLMDTMTDPLGQITDYDYDALGRLTRVTFAKGTSDEASQGFEYDLSGNRTAFIDENGNATRFEYDLLNRMVRIEEADPDGNGPLLSPVTVFVYDANGNLIESTDVRGNTSKNEYDELNRTIRVEDADGNDTVFEYDNNGNLLSASDSLRHTTTNVYDARNRIVETIDPDGGTTSFTYDLDNNLASLQDPVGNLSRFLYDSRNRMTGETDPLGKSTVYEYDNIDNLVSKTDRNLRNTRFHYDDVDRVIEELWFNADGSNANTIDYLYDANSNLTGITDFESSLALEHDARDRVQSVDNAGTPDTQQVVLSYEYDGVGNVLAVEDSISGTPAGTTSYAYDALNRMQTILQLGSDVSGKRVDFAYNQLGQFATIDRRAGLTESDPRVALSTYTYDTLNRLDLIAHIGANSNQLAFFDLEFDAASRIISIDDIDGLTTFSHDDRDQLTGADRTAADLRGDESYAYDANGNRTDSHLHGELYQTDANNRLVSDGVYGYGYDDEGNQVLRTAADGSTRSLSYDHRNRLVSVLDKDASGNQVQLVEFIYDALDRRIARSVTDVQGTVTRTDFVYDGIDVALEFEGSELTVRYLHGPAVDQVIAQEDASGQVLWHLTDHLGTTHDLIDSTGEPVQHFQFDSYGQLLSSNVPMTRYLFTGREYEIGLELYYYRARHFDASIGVFTTEDPIRFQAGDTNLFRYVLNRPTASTDPLGFESKLSQLYFDVPPPSDGERSPPKSYTEPSSNVVKIGRRIPPRLLDRLLRSAEGRREDFLRFCEREDIKKYIQTTGDAISIYDGLQNAPSSFGLLFGVAQQAEAVKAYTEELFHDNTFGVPNSKPTYVDIGR